MLKGGVGGEDGVVWLDNGAAHFRCRVHTEFELRFLAVVRGETLHQESAKSRASSTTERVENLEINQQIFPQNIMSQETYEEALQTGAVICQSPELIDADIDDLLSNSIVTAGV